MIKSNTEYATYKDSFDRAFKNGFTGTTLKELREFNEKMNALASKKYALEYGLKCDFEEHDCFSCDGQCDCDYCGHN